jgi:hypothetical protein
MVRFCRAFCISLLLVLSVFFSKCAHGQEAKLIVKTLKCEEGRVLHPTDVTVSIFDAGNVSQIIRMDQVLKATLTNVNSDTKAIQKAEDIYASLLSHVANTPALARSNRLPSSCFMFRMPSTRRILVFSSYVSESDSFTYAMRELEIFPQKVNQVVLDFSSGKSCNY